MFLFNKLLCLRTAEVLPYQVDNGLFVWQQKLITGNNVKYFLILLLAIVIFIISITLGSNNDQVVTLNYLIAKGDFSVSTLLASLFGMGFVLGWLVCGAFYLRTRMGLANARRKIKRLESQLGDSNKNTAEMTVPVTLPVKE